MLKNPTILKILSESNVVSALLIAAMQAWTNSERRKAGATLKVVLSALWNLSAHCRKNKASFYLHSQYITNENFSFRFEFQADICAMDGSLAFLANLLRHPNISIVENGGGILRNISSFIATNGEGERYR